MNKIILIGLTERLGYSWSYVKDYLAYLKKKKNKQTDSDNETRHFLALSLFPMNSAKFQSSEGANGYFFPSHSSDMYFKLFFCIDQTEDSFMAD